jgi:hypothetical protein
MGVDNIIAQIKDGIPHGESNQTGPEASDSVSWIERMSTCSSSYLNVCCFLMLHVYRRQSELAPYNCYNFPTHAQFLTTLLPIPAYMFQTGMQ